MGLDEVGLMIILLYQFLYGSILLLALPVAHEGRYQNGDDGRDDSFHIWTITAYDSTSKDRKKNQSIHYMGFVFGDMNDSG